MARFKADALGRLLERMVDERKSTAARENKLVGALNGLLAKMGYQVVERDAGGPGRTARRRRRRAGGRRGRKPGRPAKAQRKGRGRRAVAKRGRKLGGPAKARAKGQRRRGGRPASKKL